MPLFRLLHGSDLHCARVSRQIGLPDLSHAWATGAGGSLAPVSSHNDIYTDAFAAFAHANRNGFDVIVLTGDLATTGDSGDLRAAHRFVIAPAVNGYLSGANRPTLQAAGKPVVLLPGNHDRFRAFHLPGGTAFDAAFGASWHARQSAQILWVKQREMATLVLIGVDFSLRRSDVGGPFQGFPLLGFLGQGRAYPRRIQALQQATQTARTQYPGCTVLWVLHFEPDAANGNLALLDDQNLAAALRQDEGIAAILCGHTHVSNPVKVFAGTPVYVCGTTTQHASVHGNGFHVLEVNMQVGTTTQITCRPYRYDPGAASFV
jgi:3',5'-cyclic AMP phosphodiesterase CpdA